jgi:hypothetical protein
VRVGEAANPPAFHDGAGERVAVEAIELDHASGER